MQTTQESSVKIGGHTLNERDARKFCAFLYNANINGGIDTTELKAFAINSLSCIVDKTLLTEWLTLGETEEKERRKKDKETAKRQKQIAENQAWIDARNKEVEAEAEKRRSLGLPVVK
jgi:hypothetical protein